MAGRDLINATLFVMLVEVSFEASTCVADSETQSHTNKSILAMPLLPNMDPLLHAVLMPIGI